MNYEHCLKYLEKIQNLGIKFGLDNVRTVLSSLGDPHKAYASILAAGSNGKGSVCAFLTRILSLQGYSVGLFTSPHLVKVEERIRINDQLIPQEHFCSILTRVKKEIDTLISRKKLVSPPTYFELMTCLAFLYFKEIQVDLAVMEVGMGGRFDATNVGIPVISVITTISKEHQKFLGQSLSQIAFEKAGIIKPEVPVISGVIDDDAKSTIKQRALELNSPFFDVFSDERSFKQFKNDKNFTFEYTSCEDEYVFSPSLFGEHQGRNAAIAIEAAEELNRSWGKIDKRCILNGLETTRWPGRMEIISESPLIILDGAHNEEGAAALKNYISDFIGNPVTLVFAVMRDKKIEKIADILFPLAERIIITRFSYFKAADPEDILKQVPQFEEKIQVEPDVSKAALLARELSGPQGAIVMAGSLFLIGEIKKHFSSSVIRESD
jgi:dihydrofolate synthase/folylpolyglutamate synthase